MTLIYKQDRMPGVVLGIFQELGWEEYDEKIHNDEEWNVHWKPTRPTMGEYNAGKPYQKLIHFPKTGILCTKDNLARLLKRNKQLFGAIYNFIPMTFCLPNETKAFIQQFTRERTRATEDKKKIWICKPTDLSRGRKITILSDINELQYDQQSVIQEYISNPHLIRGTKWDMRIYVLITQMRPLKLYLFQEGIVRFSSERYDTSSLNNVYSHLTNSSINKYAPTNVTNADGSGLKWTFDSLRSYFMHNGYSYEEMWVKIETIIILTCINLCSLVPDLQCCFELLGFDIMLDQNLKPWLLEVNSSPAMSMDNAVDYQVKPPLIKDIVKIVNFEPYVDYLERTTKKPQKSSLHENKFFAKRAPVKRKDGYSNNQSGQSEQTKKQRPVAQSQYAKPGRKLESDNIASTTSFKPPRPNNINGIKLSSLDQNPKATLNKLVQQEHSKGMINRKTKSHRNSQNSAEYDNHSSQEILEQSCDQSSRSDDNSNSNDEDEVYQGVPSISQIKNMRLKHQQKQQQQNRGAERPQKMSYSTTTGSTVSSLHGGNNLKSYSSTRKRTDFSYILPKVNSNSRGLQNQYNVGQPKGGSIEKQLEYSKQNVAEMKRFTEITNDCLQQSERNQLQQNLPQKLNNELAYRQKIQNQICKASSQSIKRKQEVEEESEALQKMDIQALQASRESASQMKQQAEIQKDRRGTQMKQHQTPVTAQRALAREEKKAASAKVPKYDANIDNSAHINAMLARDRQEKDLGFRMGTASSNHYIDMNNKRSEYTGSRAQSMQNQDLPPPGKFEREKQGGFQLIFPFNKKSEELAFAMNRTVGGRANMGGPNLMKMLVQEVKQWDQEYSQFVKSGRFYARQ